MLNYFIVVSGLPGSGKSALAQQLARALDLPVLDKDHILERMFESKGLGDSEWRRELSRESDLVLQAEAAASEGAVLVSHWRLPGMPSTSGTPGHLDHERSHAAILASIRQLASFGTLDISPRIEVDTSHPPDPAVVLNEIDKALVALALEG